MYERIVLAYEGSEFSAGALQQSAELARLCAGQLHVLGIAVTTGGMAIAESVGPDDIWSRGQHEIEQVIEGVVRKLRDQHLTAIACVRSGDPASQIVRYAQEIEADLVVLGHTHKGLLARLMQGSVGAKLLNQLPCNLLVARSKH
jgi:nucleotide-binding universal stress UspA family protein